MFMKPTIKDGNKYYGERNGTPYLIRDGKASYFYKVWKETKPSLLAAKVLHDNSLWGGIDLSVLEGFAASVQEKLNDMLIDGVHPVVDAVGEGREAIV
jgi:tagaturonate reductase